MTFDPPLKGRYWFTVALVLLVLVPDLLLSTAMPLLRTLVVATRGGTSTKESRKTIIALRNRVKSEEGVVRV